MYKPHTITFRKEDLPKAMEITMKHEDDFDKIIRGVVGIGDSRQEITFKFYPYIYEDFVKLKNEFIKNGIQVK